MFFFSNNFKSACLWDVTNFLLTFEFMNASKVLSVLPKKFHKTLLSDYCFLEICYYYNFSSEESLVHSFHHQKFFFLSWLKVVSEISLRNSLYACFVFLSFLWNKLSKNLSNSSQISTKLSISLLFISHLLTVTCVAFVFSRFRTNLFDFSPSSYHWQLLLILMYSAILS